MSQAESITKTALQPSAVSPGRDSVIAIAMVLFVTLLIAFSLYRQNPPAVIGANAPAPEFSATRAMQHLEVISRRPHQIGTAEHAVVRDYLLKELTAQGLTPEVQTATAVNPVWKDEFRAGTVENVIAKLPGTANTKAVMLVAHYDSVHNGYGASDDGAAVAALLESLRALKSVPALKNDVIFLFTDGEEPGLLGAHAFAKEHPLARDVGLALNFEARGIRGPSIMFETSPQNGWLIKEYAASAPHPVSHSLAYEIYRLLPNDTDFTVFKKANLPGLNFAYINGLTHYHTALDTVGAIDQRSLQHHGSSALALSRHFGNLDLRNTQARNAVYFDLLGATLVRYPGAFILPLAILTTLAFAGLLIYGLRKRRLTVRGLLWGFVALLASLTVAPLVVRLLWNLVLRYQDVAGVRSQGEAYESNLFFISFVTLTLAITSAFYIFFRTRTTIENLSAGALLIWLVLLWLASWFLPGASYLPTWLLLFNLAPLAYLLIAKEPNVKSTRFLLLLFFAALPGLVLLAPLILQTYIGLTLQFIAALSVLMVLLIGLMLPHLKLVATPGKWLLPSAMLVIAVGFLGAGIFASDYYDAQQPKLNAMFYGLNSETQASIWATPDREPDEWLVKFLRSPGAGPLQRGPLPDFFGARTNRPFASAQTDALPLAGPQLAMLSDKNADGMRSVVLRVSSQRRAPVVSIYIDSEADVQSFAINGRKVDSISAGRNAWTLRYHGLPAEGIELALDVKAQEPLKFRVVDQSYGLPELPEKPVPPRPSGLIPSSFPFNDSTLVAKSFVF